MSTKTIKTKQLYYFTERQQYNFKLTFKMILVICSLPLDNHHHVHSRILIDFHVLFLYIISSKIHLPSSHIPLSSHFIIIIVRSHGSILLSEKTKKTTIPFPSDKMTNYPTLKYSYFDVPVCWNRDTFLVTIVQNVINQF